MVNLGNVLPDVAFTVFKQVIPHSWKQGHFCHISQAWNSPI